MPDQKLHAPSTDYIDAATGRAYIITRCGVQIGAKSIRLINRDRLRKMREEGSTRACETCST